MAFWSINAINKNRKEAVKHLKNFIIFDIETVHDVFMFDSIASDKELQMLSKGEFLPLPFHKVISLSYILIKDGKVEKFLSVFSEDEGFILETFWECFGDAHIIHTDGGNKGITHFPVLVSVNGKDFDMPVIKIRTLQYVEGFRSRTRFFISLYLDKFDKWEREYPQYSNRYTDYHIDIPMDIFGKKISLKNLCYMCNIPVKEKGSGSLVQRFYDDGDYYHIAAYCAEDVKATALLFSYINQFFLRDLYLFPRFYELKDIEPEIKVL